MTARPTALMDRTWRLARSAFPAVDETSQQVRFPNGEVAAAAPWAGDIGYLRPLGQQGAEVDSRPSGGLDVRALAPGCHREVAHFVGHRTSSRMRVRAMAASC